MSGNVNNADTTSGTLDVDELLDDEATSDAEPEQDLQLKDLGRRCWGRLVAVAADYDPTSVKSRRAAGNGDPSVRWTSLDLDARTNRFVFGRGDEAHPKLHFPDNKNISSTHAKLTRDPTGKAVALESLGANPTYVNDQKLVKGSVRILRDGDIIALAKKGDARFPHYVFRLAESTSNGLATTGAPKRALDSVGSGSGSAVKKQKTIADSGEASASGTTTGTGSKDEDDEEMDLMCSASPKCVLALPKSLIIPPTYYRVPCPTCRTVVTSVGRDHTLQRFAERFLAKHPDKARSAEEETDMVTRGIVKTGELRLIRDGDDADDSDGESDEEDEDDDGAPGFQCELCNPNNGTGFVCANPGGCTNPTCATDFKKIGDHEFTHLLPSTFGFNLTEQKLLSSYLTATNTSMTDVYRAVLPKYLDGTYTGLGASPPLPAGALRPSDDSYLCKGCANRLLSGLAYEYRRDLDKTAFWAALPQDVRDQYEKRPDCWYGRDCRTQRKVPHAEKLNHIGENVRRT
ncbi:hypothetical protein HDU93_004971 [Gonapodya sp. JEL0774]|nr:hypothetical protein HDU93_004971 [Gonapodya sp. JEL0774]